MQVSPIVLDLVLKVRFFIRSLFNHSRSYLLLFVSTDSIVNSYHNRPSQIFTSFPILSLCLFHFRLSCNWIQQYFTAEGNREGPCLSQVRRRNIPKEGEDFRQDWTTSAFTWRQGIMLNTSSHSLHRTIGQVRFLRPEQLPLLGCFLALY